MVPPLQHGMLKEEKRTIMYLFLPSTIRSASNKAVLLVPISPQDIVQEPDEDIEVGGKEHSENLQEVSNFPPESTSYSKQQKISQNDLSYEKKIC